MRIISSESLLIWRRRSINTSKTANFGNLLRRLLFIRRIDNLQAILVELIQVRIQARSLLSHLKTAIVFIQLLQIAVILSILLELFVPTIIGCRCFCCLIVTILLETAVNWFVGVWIIIEQKLIDYILLILLILISNNKTSSPLLLRIIEALDIICYLLPKKSILEVRRSLLALFIIS